MRVFISLSAIWFCINAILSGTLGGTEAEMRALLVAKLNSTDYSPKVRPIKDTGNVLRLEVDMYLVAINNVDEVEQKITTTAYMKIKWSDTFMTWTPSDYGNISEFTLPQNDIWKPDLALANAFDTVTGLGDKFMYLTITHDGIITWEPYQVFESSCNLDMTYFPFDSQSCDIQLVTWSSTRDMIAIVTGSDGFVTDSYEPNANWELQKVSTSDSSTTLTSGLSFTMNIRRKPVFYLINFMIPIALLSILNTFVFILPCDSGEKTGYAIVLFLSFAIFLLIVTEIMPEGMNTIPIISTYLLIECVFSTLIVIITIVQLRLHNQDEETPVTLFLQIITEIVLGLKRKFCCESDKDDQDETTTEHEAEAIPMKTLTTRSKKQMASNEMAIDDEISEKRGYEDRKETHKKKHSICCGGDDGTDADEEHNSQPSTSSSSSRKTSIRLADILGTSNKISPNAYFRKPASVNSIAIEDFDDVEEIMTRKPGSGARSNGVRVSVEANIHSKKPPLPDDDHSNGDNGSDKDEVTWPSVAMALDNLFFVLFLIINTLITIIIFIVCASNQ